MSLILLSWEAKPLASSLERPPAQARVVWKLRGTTPRGLVIVLEFRIALRFLFEEVSFFLAAFALFFVQPTMSYFPAQPDKFFVSAIAGTKAHGSCHTRRLGDSGLDQGLLWIRL